MTTPHDEQARPMHTPEQEPWQRDNLVSLPHNQHDRAVKCWNACAGMEDPVEEIAKLRATQQVLVDALKAIQRQDLEDCGIADDDIRMADLWRSEVYVLASEALKKVGE